MRPDNLPNKEVLGNRGSRHVRRPKIPERQSALPLLSERIRPRRIGDRKNFNLALIIPATGAPEAAQLGIAKSGRPRNGPTTSSTRTNPPHHGLSTTGEG